MRRLAFAVLASGLLLASAFGAEKPRPTVHASMTHALGPQSEAIWDVTNRAFNDEGEPDASKISAADWSSLAAAGRGIRESSLQLATAEKLVAADPGVKIQNEGVEGGASAAQVQGYIDADRAAFAEHARRLAAIGDAIEKAAATKDAAAIFAASDNMQPACESCHAQFWFPEQAQPPQ